MTVQPHPEVVNQLVSKYWMGRMMQGFDFINERIPISDCFGGKAKPLRHFAFAESENQFGLGLFNTQVRIDLSKDVYRLPINDIPDPPFVPSGHGTAIVEPSTTKISHQHLENRFIRVANRESFDIDGAQSPALNSVSLDTHISFAVNQACKICKRQFGFHNPPHGLDIASVYWGNNKCK